MSHANTNTPELQLGFQNTAWCWPIIWRQTDIFRWGEQNKACALEDVRNEDHRIILGLHLWESSGLKTTENAFRKSRGTPRGQVPPHHRPEASAPAGARPRENCWRHAAEATRRGICLGAAILRCLETNDALNQVSRMAAPRALSLKHKCAEPPACFVTCCKLFSGFPLLRGLDQLSWVYLRQIIRELQRMHHRKVDCQRRVRAQPM